MYLAAKNIFDNKCIFTIRDFENAQKNISGRYKIEFKEFKFHDNTKKILQATGIIFHPNFGRIRVVWNYQGKAFIANESFPEFDLPIKKFSY